MTKNDVSNEIMDLMREMLGGGSEDHINRTVYGAGRAVDLLTPAHLAALAKEHGLVCRESALTAEQLDKAEKVLRGHMGQYIELENGPELIRRIWSAMND